MTAPTWRSPGVVVLAAYRPQPELFRIQLESIRDQTRTDWRCLVGADGGQEEVRRLVAESVGDDPRFEVVGWDDNVGFYLNFERLLGAVPEDAGWVALSDQDDRWYPDKLERLLPSLEHGSLALGQARVVAWPDHRVLAHRTARRVVPAGDLLMTNQVTGALCVLRRDLLDLALPFPRLATVTQLHDHWLGLCAAATGSYAVLDEVVQDYVQHGANLVGEDERRAPRTPAAVLRLITSTADRDVGGHGIREIADAGYRLGFGWRRAMVRALVERGVDTPLLTASGRDLAPPVLADTRRSALSVLAAAVRSGTVPVRTVATFALGLPRALTRPHPGGMP